VALTAEEVAMEYALGRTGKSINLTDTALCLGGTVPRAQLDVRGSARFGTMNVDGTVNTGALTATSATVPNDGDFVMGGKPLKPAGGLHWDRVNSRLGVGTVSPTETLDVAGASTFSGNVLIGTNASHPQLVVYSPSSTAVLKIHRVTDVGETNLQLYGEHSGGSTDWQIYHSGATANLKFWRGSDRGYISYSASNTSLNFTGQHRTFIKDVPFMEAGDLEGLIVSADQNKYIKMSGGIAVGSNAITTNESLPLVSLSTKVNDKKCFGVISASEDPETRHEAYGNFVSISEKELGDTRVYINSVGEGAMWVTNINGPLESGDYITTSNVAGYGQRQESEFLANYTVAKITMDCDFEPATQPIQIIKKELGNVNYWVKTTVSNVTLEEYSNLAEENRTTELETYYTKDIEQTYTYKPTVEVTAEDSWDDVSMWPSDVTYAEWSNLEANVQNTYTLTYTQNDFETVRYEKTTVSNVSSEDGWDMVHIEPSTVTYAEWSNLEANVQNTFTLTYTTTATVVATEEEYTHLVEEEQVLYEPVYTKTTTEEVGVDTEGADVHTRPIYKKIEREESKTETEGYDLEVREELVNALDEHGQLQWEDDPLGATEKAYKIRYLDASGTQTDEANAVHIAAFVGVTYHCG